METREGIEPLKTVLQTILVPDKTRVIIGRYECSKLESIPHYANRRPLKFIEHVIQIIL